MSTLTINVHFWVNYPFKDRQVGYNADNVFSNVSQRPNQRLNSRNVIQVSCDESHTLNFSKRVYLL